MERCGETRTHSQRVPVGPGASGQTVRSSDHAVSLWKEELKPGGAQWVKISDVAEDGSLSS